VTLRRPADGEGMSLLIRRWRIWMSPAARRGRQAHQEYVAFAEKQRARRDALARAAAAETHSA
jgi:hypothetical protein